MIWNDPFGGGPRLDLHDGASAAKLIYNCGGCPTGAWLPHCPDRFYRWLRPGVVLLHTNWREVQNRNLAVKGTLDISRAAWVGYGPESLSLH